MMAESGPGAGGSGVAAVRVRIDRDTCLSSQTCVRHLPDVFAIDDDGVAAVLPGARDAEVVDLVEAARACPVGAIEVLDDDGMPLDLH